MAVVFILSTGSSPAHSFPPESTQASALTSPSAPGQVNNEPTTAPIAISAACAQHNGGTVSGHVASVDDQGSIEVITGVGSIRARFAGIKLLPSGQPGQKTLQALRDLVINQPVLLVRDRAASTEIAPVPSYIFTSEKFINDELVRQGMAEIDLDAAEQSCAAVFQLSEQKARSAKVGMWAPTRVPTLTFVPFVTLDTSQQPACDCSVRLECSDFTTHAEAQACYNACNDYNSRLDDDRDGIACELLP